MARRVIVTAQQLDALTRELATTPRPFMVTITAGKGRGLTQNSLAWKWAQEIAAHQGDTTANDIWAYNKLHHGVPLRRETDPDFAEVYDRVIKPLPYEDKLAIMKPPIDLPVTREMSVAVMSKFMDAVRLEWTRRGVVLTQPEGEEWA